MTIFDLQHKLQNGLWAMLPEDFDSLKATVEAVINGNMSYSFDPEPYPPEDDDSDLTQDGTALVIPIKGDLLKAGAMPDELCAELGIANVDDIYEDIEDAGNDPSITAIILDFNSPGGEVSSIPELAALISTVSEKKPIIGFASGLCASAAYWLGSQCDEFYCAPSALIGSVGVAYPRFDISKALAKQDIQINFVASSPRKFWGDPKYPYSPEEKAWREERVAKINAQFQEAVLSNRDIEKEYLDTAAVFDGEDAVKTNFADGNFNSLTELLGQLTNEGNTV